MSARVTPQAAIAAVVAAGAYAAPGEEKIARGAGIAVVPVVDLYVIRDDAHGLVDQRVWVGSAEILDGTVDPDAVRAAYATRPESKTLRFG